MTVTLDTLKAQFEEALCEPCVFRDRWGEPILAHHFNPSQTPESIISSTYAGRSIAQVHELYPLYRAAMVYKIARDEDMSAAMLWKLANWNNTPPKRYAY